MGPASSPQASPRLASVGAPGYPGLERATGASSLRITLVFILTLVLPSILLSVFAYQAVEAERRARLAERSSRLQGEAQDLVGELDDLFQWPARRVQAEAKGHMGLRAAYQPMTRLVELEPLFDGFFVLDGDGRRVYPASAEGRPSNPWPDPGAGLGGGVLGATRPQNPEDLLTAAGGASPERADVLLRRAAARGPVEARITALLELGRLHDARKAFSPSSLALAQDSWAALARYPVDLVDLRGRPAPALGRFQLARSERANMAPEYRERAHALLAELKEWSYALPPDALAQLCERTGALLEDEEPEALTRAREVAVDRKQVESRYSRLEELFGRVLHAALREGALPHMAGGRLEGSPQVGGGVPFVKAREGAQHEILTYALLRGATGAPAGLVAVQVDQEAAEAAFRAHAGRLGGELLLGDEGEAPADGVRLALKPPFDHLALVLRAGPEADLQAMDDTLGLPRETAQLWAILLCVVGIAAGIGVTLRTVRRESKAAQLKSDFVSNVTHELKTPLTSIQMFLDTLILGRVESEEEAKECLEVMARESQRLTRLIEQLLVFSRIENKKWRVRFTFAEPPKLVSEAIEILADHMGKSPEELNIEVVQIQETPKVPADQFAIKEALLNLLHNAVKYSPNEDRKVRVVITARRQFVEIAVEDNGMGVPKRDRRRIFVKFERGSNAEKGRVEGSGIGLTLANEIVKAHGGSIRYTALRPRGSRFSVFLPK